MNCSPPLYLNALYFFMNLYKYLNIFNDVVSFKLEVSLLNTDYLLVLFSCFQLLLGLRTK